MQKPNARRLRAWVPAEWRGDDMRARATPGSPLDNLPTMVPPDAPAQAAAEPGAPEEGQTAQPAPGAMAAASNDQPSAPFTVDISGLSAPMDAAKPGRGGRRTPGPGKRIGRPKGATKLGAYVQRTVMLTPEQTAEIAALAERQGLSINETFRKVAELGLDAARKIDTL